MMQTRLLGRGCCVGIQDNGQPIGTANNYDFRIVGLRQLQGCLDAAPTQVTLRDAWSDDLLKTSNTFGFNLFTLPLFFFQLKTEVIGFTHMPHANFLLNRGAYESRKFNFFNQNIFQADV